MNMKNKKLGYSILAISFVIFSVIVLSIPTIKSAAFWISYGFTAISFIAQIIIWKVAFKNAETLKSKFLGIPIIHISSIYLITQIIASIVFLSFAKLDSWISVVVSVVILGFASILMISSEIAKDEVNRVDEKIKPKIDFIRTAQCELELLASCENDAKTKAQLSNLAERIRYSDPMSNDSLKSIEDRIVGKIAELKLSDSKTEIIGEIDTLLTERNSKSKLSK